MKAISFGVGRRWDRHCSEILTSNDALIFPSEQNIEQITFILR